MQLYVATVREMQDLQESVRCRGNDSRVMSITVFARVIRYSYYSETWLGNSNDDDMLLTSQIVQVKEEAARACVQCAWAEFK